jgi:hypothetical protein
MIAIESIERWMTLDSTRLMERPAIKEPPHGIP